MIAALQGASASLNILNFKTSGALRNMLPLAMSAVLILLGQLVETEPSYLAHGRTGTPLPSLKNGCTLSRDR